MSAQKSARQAHVGHHCLAGPHQAPRPHHAPLPKAAGARLGALLGPAIDPAVLRSHNHARRQPVWPCQAQSGRGLCIVSLLLLLCSLGFLFNGVQVGLPGPSQQAGATSARGGALPAGRGEGAGFSTSAVGLLLMWVRRKPAASAVRCCIQLRDIGRCHHWACISKLPCQTAWERPQQWHLTADSLLQTQGDNGS